MNNTNFNANDLPYIERWLNEIENGYHNLSWAGDPQWGDHNTGGEVYRYLKSEDSNLSQTWQNTAELVSDMERKAVAIISKIVVEINKYASATVQNESDVAKAVSDINTSISGSRNELDNIDI